MSLNQIQENMRQVQKDLRNDGYESLIIFATKHKDEKGDVTVMAMTGQETMIDFSRNITNHLQNMEAEIFYKDLFNND
jgi:hypothetical protein